MSSNYSDKLILDRQAMKDRSTSHLRIYVGGLTDQADVDELYEHFIPYGKINGIIVNRNFGFVQFEEESSAQEAITKANGSIFQGKNINVRTSQTNTDKRQTEVKITQPDLPAAVALNDNLLQSAKEDGAEDPYDNYGNFIGDQIEAPGARKGRTRTRPRSRRRSRKSNEASPPTKDTSADTSNFREEEYEEGYSGGWNEGRGGRGRGVRGRGRGARGRGAPASFRDRERSPVPGGRGEWSDRSAYDRYQPPEYPRALPVPERNDCEIIVVSKSLTEYAEYIEGRLKRLGIVVDLLFPMEDVPIGKVLGNIASRGCLYAILVMPQNQENRSLTLTILHGLPQEHRNMPLEDSLQLLSRNFQEVQRGGPSGREAVYALLGQLADGRTLTVLQYDKVIEYLQERKEQQVKIELGEPLTTAPATKTQVDLQQRILSILNDKKVTTPIIEPAPVAAPSPVPAVAPAQNKLLNDPTVRKAQTEVKITQPDLPAAVALNDNLLQSVKEDGAEDPYDNYGNFIGDQIEAPGARKGRTRTRPRSRRRSRKSNEASPPTKDTSADTSNFREEEYEEGYSGGWNEGRGGRGRGARGRGRGARGRGAPASFRDRERSPVPGGRGEWSDRSAYDRYQPPEYPRALPVPERNDCEIIVVSKSLTEYAEYIEGRLKRLGIVVDLLFPMEDVPIGKVLGNIASRGCLYAILVMPQNQENRSLTLTILHGLPQEHRNMPLEDSLQLLSRNFQEVQRGGPSGREAVYALLGQLADGRTLTVLQYDKVIEYLQERKEQQVKIELGEPLTTAPATKTQVDLQQRILSILNDKKVTTPIIEPAPVAAPSPVPAVAPAQNKLLNDPTVRKALDSILQKFT